MGETSNQKEPTKRSCSNHQLQTQQQQQQQQQQLEDDCATIGHSSQINPHILVTNYGQSILSSTEVKFGILFTYIAGGVKELLF